MKAVVSATDVPVKFAIKPDLVKSGKHSYSLMSGRSSVTISGSANEYETLDVKIGSYSTTVKVDGSGDYTLGEKGNFS